MSSNDASANRSKVLLEGVVQNPLRFRVALGIGLVVVWFFVFYQPAVSRIELTRDALTAERKQLDTALQIDLLRRQVAAFQSSQPSRTDQNEMVQYLVAAIRQRPVKLVNLEPRGTIELGPYRVQQITIVIEGDYASLVALLHWIESDPRLFRIERLRLEAERVKSDSSNPALRPCKLDIGVLGILS
jgi:type II secretory pathway component PulM